MNIRVWSNFSKRTNSTRQPQAADGTVISCYLKEETSIRNPSFILADPMPAITYVQAFGNYYFVTDVINMDANRSEVVCSLDVLATYRSSILGYTAFVERSASNYDVLLRDPLLSAQQNYSVDDVTTTDVSDIFNQTGLYAATVLTKTRGLVIYLSNSLGVYRGILDSGCYAASDIADWITSKIAASFDIDVYIGSVKWMPLNLANHGLSLDLTANPPQFVIGPLGVKAEVIPGGSVVKWIYPETNIGTLKKLNLPSTNIYNDFRDGDPRFVQYSLTLPGIGTVQLDSSFVGSCIHNSRDIYVGIYMDISTGQITYIIETFISGYYVKFCEFKGTCAVDVPIGKSRANPIETATTFIGGTSAAVSSLLGGGGTAGSIAGGAGTSIVTGLSTIDAAISPQTSILGGGGNRSDLWVHANNIYLNRKIFGQKQFALNVAGRPLMQNVQLSTLSGFCQCGNASLPVNARDAERAEINSYLNSGFYIE